MEIHVKQLHQNKFCWKMLLIDFKCSDSGTLMQALKYWNNNVVLKSHNSPNLSKCLEGLL